MHQPLAGAITMSVSMTCSTDAPLAVRELRLDQLPKGARARVLRIEALDSFGQSDEQVTQRLKELGFLPGARLRVVGFGLLGRDPIAVHINGTKFALRGPEARKIVTEVIEQA